MYLHLYCGNPNFLSESIFTYMYGGMISESIQQFGWKYIQPWGGQGSEKLTNLPSQDHLDLILITLFKC